MFDKEFIAILACPACKEPLEMASPEVIIKIVQTLKEDNLPPIEAGLLCRSHNHVFIVQEGVPVLLLDQSIPIDSL